MTGVFKQIVAVSGSMLVFLAVSMLLGLSMGSSGAGFSAVSDFFTDAFNEGNMMHDIIWKIRFPRVLLAALVGATLSLGGLVFQALLRNPLAEKATDFMEVAHLAERRMD